MTTGTTYPHAPGFVAGDRPAIVTGRFHMVCMAMLAGTPFIALPGNTHKIEGMLEDANLSNRHCPSLANGREDVFAWSNWRDDDVARI